MVGGADFLEAQGPELLQKQRQSGPAQAQRAVREALAAHQPLAHVYDGSAQKGERGLRTVQPTKPAAERSRIGYPLGIFDHGRRRFPGAALHETAAERLAVGQQAVVCIGEGKARKERKALLAAVTVAAPDPDPVVVFIMSLLAAAAVADNRIARAFGTAPRNDLGANGPIAFEVVFPVRKWDKKYRVSGGSAWARPTKI
jgi:hypothetical protein